MNGRVVNPRYGRKQVRNYTITAFLLGMLVMGALVVLAAFLS